MRMGRYPFSLLLLLFCNCSVTSSPMMFLDQLFFENKSASLEYVSQKTLQMPRSLDQSRVKREGNLADFNVSESKSLEDAVGTQCRRQKSFQRPGHHGNVSDCGRLQMLKQFGEKAKSRLADFCVSENHHADTKSIQYSEQDSFKVPTQLEHINIYNSLGRLDTLSDHEPGYLPLQRDAILESIRTNKLISHQIKMVVQNTDQTPSLKRLLLMIYRQYLENCDLIIVTDRSFISSEIVHMFVHTGGLKQIFYLEEADGLPDSLVWTGYRCKGVIFLNSELGPLQQFMNGDTIFSWDYQARVIVAGLTKDAYWTLCKTKMSKKTEHIVGIIKNERSEQYILYTHQLYGERGLLRLATWQDTSFTTKVNLFPDKVSNLQQANLNVIAFEWPPAIFYERDPDGNTQQLYGRDPSVINALSKIFNFTIAFIEPHPDELWGVQLENGSYNGMVGLLGSGQGDLAIANLYLTALAGRSAFQEFSSPFADDLSCYMTRVDPPLPRWQSLGLPFQWITWAAILLGIFCVGPVLFVLDTASSSHALQKSSFRSLTTSSLYVLGIHFNSPLPILPSCPSTRVFIAFLLIYCIILTTGYRSNLTAFLTVSRQPYGIETFADLYKSGQMVLGFPFYKVAMSQSQNAFLRALTNRFDNRFNFEEIKKEILLGKAVAINSLRYLEFVGSQVTSAKGRPLVRIMKECFSPYNVGIAYQKNSPLKKKFDRAITSMFEKGLVRKWFLESIVHYHKLRAREQESKAVPDEGDIDSEGVIALGMDHMQGVFIILALGFLSATISFASELTIERKTRIGPTSVEPVSYQT